MKLSLYVGERRDLARCLDEIERGERLGLHAAWLPETASGLEPLTVLALAAPRTDRLGLGAGIVHSWPRHPAVLARQALTLQAGARGRLSLGIGVGHRPLVEAALGLRWRAPARHMGDYAAVLGELLRTRRGSRAGGEQPVDIALEIASAPPPELVVAALGRAMSRVAGRVADGVMTWLAPPAHLAQTVLPATRAGAAAAGRSSPRLIAALPAALADNRAQAHAGMNAAFGSMSRAPAYAAAVEAAGVRAAAPAGGWTREAFEAVAACGDERELRGRVTDLLDAGADEVVLWPFAVGDDAAGSTRATVEALGRIARATRDERRGATV